MSEILDKGQLLMIPDNISNKTIAGLIINEWRDSRRIIDMITANKYLLMQNIRIAKKKREYIGADGRKEENETLANFRIPSGFLRNSISQKINYAFGKPFIFNVTGGESSELYLHELNKLVTPGFHMAIKRIARNAINNGIGWGYVWINQNGELQITDTASETVYPQWSDRAHTNLDAVVRDFKVSEYNDDSLKNIKKVEYWDKNTVERYIDENGELLIDVIAEGMEELPFATAHMVNENMALGWGKVPFIPFKGNEDELPLLNMIKANVDAYDELNSKSIDSLYDDIDATLLLKGYDPQMGELHQARNILKHSRVVAVASDGDAGYLQVKTDIGNVQVKLEHLKKDIREFSATVDTQDIKFGSNPSGIALKAMYQDLDIYIEGLQSEFRVFFNHLKYFIDRWLEFKGIGTAEYWNDYKINVTLNRDILVNEDDLIRNTVELAKTGVSQQTIDEYNPATDGYEAEEKRRRREIAGN
jgi:SPP1 family phage portal protein